MKLCNFLSFRNFILLFGRSPLPYILFRLRTWWFSKMIFCKTCYYIPWFSITFICNCLRIVMMWIWSFILTFFNQYIHFIVWFNSMMLLIRSCNVSSSTLFHIKVFCFKWNTGFIFLNTLKSLSCIFIKRLSFKVLESIFIIFISLGLS